MTVGEMCREDCVFTSFRMLLCIVMAGSWSDLQRSVWKCPVFLCRLPDKSDFADVLKSAFQNFDIPLQFRKIRMWFCGTFFVRISCAAIGSNAMTIQTTEGGSYVRTKLIQFFNQTPKKKETNREKNFFEKNCY